MSVSTAFQIYIKLDRPLLLPVVTPALVLRPAKNVAVNLGCTMRDQNVETDIVDSNIDLSLSGASLALRVSF